MHDDQVRIVRRPYPGDVSVPTSINNIQPSLGLTQYITKFGIFPPRGDGSGLDGSASGGFIAAIHTFASNFVPSGTSALNGSLLTIQQNTAFFSLLGTNYGGNGTTNFAVPNAQGSLTVGDGQGPGLTDRWLGDRFGSSTTTLLQSQLPASSGGSSAAVLDVQPTLTINYAVAVSGIFPSSGGAGGPATIGSVLAFAGNFAPAGYLPADGRLLAIADYEVLFQLIGTTYGGDGQTNFALPDLRGRAIVGTGGGFPLGSVSGSENDQITLANMPVAMGGSAQPVDNSQPSIALNYLIALSGIFPSRDGNSGGNDDQVPFLGEILAVTYNFAPRGYAVCNGQLLSIQQNQALFSLLGPTFGGNGTTNFALPDLRGRSVISTGAPLDNPAGFVNLGDKVGQASYTIAMSDIPALNIPGTAVADNLFGGDLNDIINGQGGNDTLTGNDGADTMNGGMGNDNIKGGAGADSLSGVAGNDFLTGGTGSDNLNGGADFDYANYLDTSTAAGITVSLAVATAQNTGGAGTDTLTAIEGLYGSNFGDTLTGDGAAVNTLYGWCGADLLTGAGGYDYIEGGEGDYTLDGGAGDDYLLGGNGTDWVTYYGSTAAVYVDMSGASAFANGAAIGFDVLSGIERVYGSIYGDILYGSAGADTLAGDMGSDVIYGFGLGDSLDGGGDTDYIVGGAGADTITTGAGQDYIYFQGQAEGKDTVTDWRAGGGFDLLVIDEPAFGGGLIIGQYLSNESWRFVAGTAATAAFGQFLWNSATSTLSWDADGTGAGAAVQLVTLTGITTLTAADILVL
jgi:microcystin-dependent protein